MPGERRPFFKPHLIEFVLMLAMLAGFARLVYFVWTVGYIPLPFVYDVTDTFMDWFNPAWWAHNGHAYDDYISIYAPLSFVILKIFGIATCYDSHPKDARPCDYIGIVSIFVTYLACVVLAAIAFYRRDRSTALYRSVGFGLGLSLLYALERGNLIMIAFIFFIIFFGMAQSRRGFVMNAALMINMKSYLLFPVLALAIKRDWRLLELCGIATIAIYLLTLAMYGSGTPLELANNLTVWFNAMASVVWDQISYSTSYAGYLGFDEHGYPIRAFILDEVITIVTIAIKSELLISRILALACIVLAWLYPGRISLHRLAFFLLMQSFIKDNPGGYGISFITFLVFLEKWTNWRIGLAIVMAYIVSIPTDFVAAVAMYVPRSAWITSRDVETMYGITVGALVRPGLLAIMLWLLAADSLIDFHRAMREGRPLLWLSRKTPAPEPKPMPVPKSAGG